PGSYRFVVEAIGSNGIASSQPAAFRFEIAPPYWRRWWFVLLSVAIATSIVYAAHRYQLERALELERVRTRIATDLHDDIGSSLSQIALLSEVARRRVNGGGATVSEPLERIAEVSRGLVDSITEIVWAIHPHRDKSSDLIQRMRRFAADVFTGSNIEYRVETSGTGKDIRLGADARRHIYLLFKEAINNIVRHSGCVHASIRLEL